MPQDLVSIEDGHQKLSMFDIEDGYSTTQKIPTFAADFRVSQPKVHPPPKRQINVGIRVSLLKPVVVRFFRNEEREDGTGA